MTKDLLWRGMLAGILAALLAALFARACAEPQVDRAIAFEESHHAHAMADDDADPPVSRAVQKSWGLATAVILYGAAVGGVFSLVFAYCYGRVGRIGPRTLAALIAALGFLIIVVVPGLKYPPNPPAVGQPDTIQLRTGVYFAMIAISIVALIVATRVRTAATRRWGSFNAMIAAIGAYAALIALAQAILPTIDEVPAAFPATVLWNFRVAAIGMQLILWTTLALAFGWMAERSLLRANACR